MAGAVDELGEDPQGHAEGRGLLLGDPGDLELLEPLEIRFREGRVEDDVGVDVEGRVELVLESGQGDGRGVEVRAGARGSAPSMASSSLIWRARALGRPLVEHGHGQGGRAGKAALVGGIARVEHQGEVDDGDGVAFGQDDLQAVRQRGPLERPGN